LTILPPGEGEGENPAEGEVVTEGEPPAEGEIITEGEGELPAEGEITAEGEGEVHSEGEPVTEGEVTAEGEGEPQNEGEAPGNNLFDCVGGEGNGLTNILFLGASSLALFLLGRRAGMQ